VRVGLLNGEYVVNPTTDQLAESDLDLVVAGTRDAILMVEAGAKGASEDVLVGAIEFAHREMQGLITLIETMRAELGHEKFTFIAPSDLSVDVVPELTEAARAGGLKDALLTPGKKERGARLKALRDA